MDGEYFIGMNYLDKKYLDYTRDKYNILVVYSTFTFLPFLELSIRFTRQLDIPDRTSSVGDRVFSFRVQLLTEKQYLLNILIGVDDIGPLVNRSSTSRFHAVYLAFSKRISNFEVTAGYSPKLFDAKTLEMLGYFCGIEVSLVKSLSVIAEYDTKHFNLATRYLFLDRISLLIGIKKFDSISGGISIRGNILN